MGITFKGIEFFPFNVGFFDDDKIALIEAEFGYKGSMIAIRLLCKIYNEGYFYQWSESERLLFVRKAGSSFGPGLVEEVVKGLVRRDFFDKVLFDSFNVLTSRDIQTIYFDAARRRKRVEVRRELLLVDLSSYRNIVYLGEDASISNENVDISEQKKRKEKRVYPPSNSPLGEERREEGNSLALDKILSDGRKRNYEGLKENLDELGLTAYEQREIMSLSNYGLIGHPVWPLIMKCRESRRKSISDPSRIRTPGSFIISQLKKADGSTG